MYVHVYVRIYVYVYINIHIYIIGKKEITAVLRHVK
jgi:hypothetical protein